MTKNRIHISIVVLILLCLASTLILLEKISVKQSSTLEQMLSAEDIVQINQYRALFDSESEPVLIAIVSPEKSLPPSAGSAIAQIEKELLSIAAVSNVLSTSSMSEVGLSREQLPLVDEFTELILLMISPGAQELAAANSLSQEIEDTVKALLQPEESVFIAGMPQVRAASWRIGNQDLKMILPLLVAITLVVALLFFNSLTALALSLLLTSLTTCICLALQLLFKAEVNALIVFVVPVIWAIATLDAFHLYSRTAIKTKQKHPHPAKAASKELFIPCLLTTLTTAGCFMTLTALDTSPLIVSFGIWGTAGTVLAFILTFTIGEKLLSMYEISDVFPRWPGMFAFKMVTLSQRYAVPTIVIWLGLTLFAIASLSQISIATSFPQVFSPDRTIAVEIDRLKQLTGSDLNGIDVIIEADSAHGENDERLASAALLTNNYLNTIVETGLVLPIGVLDAGTLEKMYTQWQAEDTGLNSSNTALIDKLGSWINNESHAVRLQAFLAETSYARKQEIVSWLEHFDETMLRHHRITLSGSGYYYYLTEKRGLSSLLWSSTFSLLTIVLAMIWLTRKSIQVAIAMAGCIIPGIIVAGAMGAFNIPWSIAMLPMPALLLGLMNDDIIHMKWSSGKNKRSSSSFYRRNAVVAGPALLATTVVLSGAYATLCLSGIQTNQYLGYLIPLGLILAFFCNLTLIPALNSCLRKSVPSQY